jgi:iron complex transport system ATP-binding protein
MSANALAPAGPPLIEYRNINVVRDGKSVLADINLTIRRGEHVAILGPNGAGKSTLIKTITREFYPIAGVPDSFMRILGEEFWDVFELRNCLGIVSGELPRSAIRDLSCFDFILSGFFGSLGIWPDQHPTAKMTRKVENILEFLEIGQIGASDIGRISTGEARKIMIGRCLVHDPPTLLLDEPTSSLDPRATREVRDILRKLAREGKSLVMITQDLSDIIPEIDRVIMLKGGRIFRDNAKARLLTSRNLSDLFCIDLHLLRRDGYYYCY